MRSEWDVLAVVSVGGALGSLGRWGVSRALPHADGQVPWATSVENLSGALLLGLLMAVVLSRGAPGRYLRPFVGVGVLGGYTTFSAYMLDTRGLLAAGHLPTALGYLLGTLAGGLVAVWAGLATGRGLLAAAGRGRREGPAR
ncbi:MAG: fluoride exporter [Nocardioidaceae bacterium]|nr:fluoride exporter [Nocardioidaceae bacterium]